jgi:hypothetical protein
VSLVSAVLNTLLRENFRGIRESVVDGCLRLGPLSVPVRPDGFLCDVAVVEPVPADLAQVLAVCRDMVDPVDIDGFDAFVAECRAAQETERTHREHRRAVLDRVTPGPGMPGALAYDTLAAYVGHPVYPTGLARPGISQADQVRHAPEYHPTFRLRWAAVPADTVTSAGALPDWWPTPDELGMPGDTVPFPVHPLTVGVPSVAGPIDVTPTLSMRTLAVLADPATHVKVPLPTSTLGLRNRRTMKPGTLVDGAVTERLLTAVLAAEPRFTGRVLLADEQTYRHAGDELLAFLVRRYPAGLESADVVPLAALPARTADGRTVLDLVADKHFGGDRLGLLTAYLTLLLDFQTTLLLRYGIALESHQQNVSLVLDDTGIRLLLKDNDGPRIRPDRFGHPELALVDDPRIIVDDTGPLVDVFTTITLHLCAAAIVFGVEGISRSAGARLIRDLLLASVDRHPDSPDRAALLAATVHADVLPVKGMVTAGTWLSKQRSGAADVNKFYLYRGPNYLAQPDDGSD